MMATLIDTCSALVTFLDGLPDCKGYPPKLYVDLEGKNLSRHGTISLVTILVHPRDTVHLVDVTTLNSEVFTTKATDGPTLQQILESADIAKVFFDIRHDSDALYALYGVRVKGICDLQLMQLATRISNRKHVNGLAKCIERDSTLSSAEKMKWDKVKKKGCELFAPEHGGDYAVFDRRPLAKEILDYSTQDVIHMPNLWNVYRPKLCDAWWNKIVEETERRIKQSQAEAFDSKGKHMAEAPVGWRYWQPTPAQKKVGMLHKFQGGKAIKEKAAVPVHHTVDLADLLESMSSWDHDEFEREAEDFAACDSECGYCGACVY
ncbi:hypothetical protein CBER1_10921 [Cercospora berteroae]|uniref:3'-5' exonuclease domain-containing protein n=1 Tax=Cercospora berteroae TaxID=357750 RepID=A0A2S6BY35_9PEZI|nr:hypothetical protein CBER1_10921 [Cercospora berteroae]